MPQGLADNVRRAQPAPIRVTRSISARASEGANCRMKSMVYDRK